MNATTSSEKAPNHRSVENLFPEEWSIVPIPKNLKYPKIKDWQKKKVDKNIIDKWKGNFGVVCGERSNDLIVFDWDYRRGNNRKKEGFEVIFKEYMEYFPELAYTLISETPHGNHFYYRIKKHEFRNTDQTNGGYSNTLKKFHSKNELRFGKYLAGFDTRANGGQAVIPPSIVDGEKYKWLTKEKPLEITKEDYDRIFDFFKEKDVPKHTMRKGFVDIFEGKIDPNKIATKERPEHVYWKEAFHEACSCLDVLPEDLLDGLAENQKGYDYNKTIKQLNDEKTRSYILDRKRMSNEKYEKYFPDYVKKKPNMFSKVDDFKSKEIDKWDTELHEKYRIETGLKATRGKNNDYLNKDYIEWHKQLFGNSSDELPKYIEVAEYCKEKFEIICLEKSNVLMIKDKNHYSFNTSSLISCISKQLTDGEVKNYSNTKYNTIENIKDTTKFPDDQFYFGVNYIPFLNGYFSIKESKLCEYSENSNILFFYGIPHEYKEDKIYDCPKFKEILKEWVVNEKSKVIIDDIFEMIGYTMTSDTGYKAIFINCGPPNTAKTQLVNIVEHIIGEENSMATSLKRLQDRFEARFLQWKILATASDMSNSIINDSSSIKNMSGGDIHNRAEIKGGDIYPFRPTAKFWCNVNKIPKIRDVNDEGLFERIILIIFEHVYKIEEENSRRNFYKTIIKDENEVQGIIHESLKGLQRLKKRKHFRPELKEGTKHRWLMLSDEVYNFIHSFCDIDKQKKIRRDKLWDVFVKEYSAAYGKGNFTKTLEKLGHKLIEKKEKGEKGKRRSFYYYSGISLKPTEANE